MAILDRLMFWKKREALPDFGSDLGLETGRGGSGPAPGAGFGEERLGLGGDELGLPPTAAQPGYGGFGQNAPFGAQAPGQTPQQRFPAQPQFQAQTAPPGFQAVPPVPVTPQAPAPQVAMVSRDIELLSYKLDTLKAAIDMVNQRLANIERLAVGETQKRSW